MKALVTGGAGFLGSHIVDLLIDRDIETHVLKSGYRSNKHPDVVNKAATVVNGNLLSIWDLYKATKDVDFVFHCGAVLSHYAEQDPEIAFDVNVKGTWLLKKACHKNGVKRIVFASTSFVYGNPQTVPVNETDPTEPKGNFEVGKLAAEKVLQAVHPFQVPYTILRMFNMYGPRSYPDGVYSQAITTFILKALKGESLEVHDNGKQELDFIYVRDAAGAFLSCINPDAINRIFNVGSGTSTPIIKLAKLINAITNNPAGIHFNNLHPAYLWCVRADINHIKNCTGWTPKTDLLEGLQKTVDFFREVKQ